MKKIWGIVGAVAVVAVLLLAMGVGKLAGRAGSDALFGEASDSELSAAVAGFNQQLPQMVDEGTRLNRLTYGPGRVLTYHYTLIRYVDPITNPNGLIDPFNPVDPMGVLADLDRFKARLTKQACANAASRKFLDQAVTVAYRYSDSDGKELFIHHIQPDHCRY